MRRIPGNAKHVYRGGFDEFITAIQVCRTDKNDETKNKIDNPIDPTMQQHF